MGLIIPPVQDEQTGEFLDPVTGEVLTELEIVTDEHGPEDSDTDNHGGTGEGWRH